MPKITKDFFKALQSTNNYDWQFFYAKQNNVTGQQFIEKKTDEIINGKMNEKALIDAIYFYSFIKQNENNYENNDITKDYLKEELSSRRDILNRILLKHFTDKQLNVILDNINENTIGDIETLDEDGTIEFTKEAIERKQEESKPVKKEKTLEEIQQEKERRLHELQQQAKTEADLAQQKKIDKQVADFKNSFSKDNFANRIIIDKEFMKGMHPTLAISLFEGYPGDKKEMYEYASEWRQEANEDALNRINCYSARQESIAHDRFKIYMGLRDKTEKETFLDILKHPWNSLMERIELSRIKSDIKNAYNLTNDCIEKIYDMTIGQIDRDGTYTVPDDFGIMNKDGKITSNKASQDKVNQKFDELKKLDEARKDFDEKYAENEKEIENNLLKGKNLGESKLGKDSKNQDEFLKGIENKLNDLEGKEEISPMLNDQKVNEPVIKIDLEQK